MKTLFIPIGAKAYIFDDELRGAQMKITIRNWKTTAYYRSLPDVFLVKLRSGKEFSIHKSQCEEIDD